MAKRLKAPCSLFSLFSFSVKSAKVLKPRPISHPGCPWSDGTPGYVSSFVPSPKNFASSQVFAGEFAENAQTALDMSIPPSVDTYNASLQDDGISSLKPPQGAGIIARIRTSKSKLKLTLNGLGRRQQKSSKIV